MFTLHLIKVHATYSDRELICFVEKNTFLDYECSRNYMKDVSPLMPQII